MVKDIISNNEQAQAGGKELEVLKHYFPQCFTTEGDFDIEKLVQLLRQELCTYVDEYGHYHINSSGY